MPTRSSRVQGRGESQTLLPRRGSRANHPGRSVQAAGQVPSRSFTASSGSSVGTRPAPDLDLVTAYWDDVRDCIVSVVREPSAETGVRFRTDRAEHSFFFRREQCDTEVREHLVNHPEVLTLADEGRWTRVVWRTREDCRNYAKMFTERKGLVTYDGAIHPVLRWQTDTPHRLVKPRRVYLDLETDSRVPFSRKEQMRLLVACMVGDGGYDKRCVLEADTDDAERTFVELVLRELERFDQVIAWNGDRFDFPVFVARVERLGIYPQWKRWLWLDHMVLFQRMNMHASESGEEKQSMALEAISQAILGYGKHEFDASKTWEAWATGGEHRAKLVNYCRHDTELMPAIEAKTGYIELLQTLCDACGTFPDGRGINPGVQVESFMQRLGKQIDHKFETPLERPKVDQYAGAYVMQPETEGIERGVHVGDFKSMYPSIIRTWNMSPETVTDEAGENTCLSTETGVRFRTDVAGVMPTALVEMGRLREEWTQKRDALPPGTPAWKEADRRSQAYKIASNSFYGVAGSPSSPRFYRRAVAESVSQCGVWLIKHTIAEAKKQGLRVVYADTDSLFVAGCSRARFEEFVRWCNEDFYPQLLRSVGCVHNYVKLGYEKEFDCIVFTSAKRYVGKYRHYKGTAAGADSRPEIKGLEFKRGDSLRLARRLQEQVCYHLVGYRCEQWHEAQQYEGLLEEFKTVVFGAGLAVEDVLRSQRLSREMDDYKVESPLVRVARMLEERGRDVGEGAKVEYVVVDAYTSPQTVVPAEDWPVEIDRYGLWDKQVAPPTLRLLEAAFPGHGWNRWAKTKPAKPRKSKEPKVAASG